MSLICDPDYSKKFEVEDSPASIWLEPQCAEAGDGRSWCADNVWVKCEECKSPDVQYIRADLVESL